MFDKLFKKNSKVLCKSCGAVIHEGEVFCRHCGAKQKDTPDAVRKDIERMLRRLLESYRAIIENNLDKASLHFQLGTLYKLKGMLDEAIGEFKMAALLDKDNPEYYLALGNIEAGRKKYPEAIEAYKKALDLHPEYADLHNNIGVAYYKNEVLDEAIEEFNKAVRLNPKYANAHNNLGIALRKKGLKKEADEEFEKAQVLDRDHVMADYELGRAYYAGGMFEEKGAATHLDEGTLGNLFMTGKMYAEAIEQYMVALEKHPEYADLHNALGKAYEWLGKQEEAGLEFQKALELNPHYKEARDNLARIQQGG